MATQENKDSFGDIKLSDVEELNTAGAIDIVGTCTDICVISNALILKAAFPEKEMQVDHIVSHMKNKGKDDLENYQPSCAVCNRVKYIDTLEEFRGTIRHCAEIHHRPKREIEADSDRICHKYGLDGDGWKTKPIVFYFEKDKK